MSFFEDASLVLIPSAQKTSKVYSVKPTDGTGDLTFTRSNDTATRVGPDGLIEKVRTNIALYSEQFDNAYWNKSGATITANATTAPDGTLTAEKFVEGSGSVTPECSRTPIATSNSIFTLSVFAKASERNFLIINNNTGLASARAWFNLSTGVVGTTAAGTTAFIENVGNGWFRCSLVNQILSFGGSTSAFQIGSADGVQTYTGDGTSGIFIWGAQMELSDFGPTPYIATTSAAVSVGPVANVPRLDYLNSSCPRLLLEPQRQNLALFSESFDNAAWTKVRSTITANGSTSPDGYANADLLVAEASSNDHFTLRSATAIIAQSFSVFAKAGGYNYVFVGADNVTTSGVFFNLTNGTISQNTSTLTAKIEDYGNGWYRCSVSSASWPAAFALIATSANGTALVHTGNGTSGVYIWGAQLEAGAYATSYIPTLGAAVTRGADAASKTGISSLIGQTEGTLFAEIKLEATNEQILIITSAAGNEVNRLQVYISTAGKVGLYRGDASVNILSSSTYNIGDTLKIAAVYKANDCALYVNGVLEGTDTSATIPPTPSVLYLGQYVNGTKTNSTAHNQAILFPTRLSNSDLAALTV